MSSETHRKSSFPPWSLVKEEAKALFAMSWQITVASCLFLSYIFVTTGFMGRLGVRALAASALGSMLSNLSFSIASGLLGAVDTLASQAYGANNKKQVGVIVQRGIWIVSVYTVPVTVLWWFIGPILLLLGQEPGTSSLAEKYLRCFSPALIPGLWAEAIKHGLICAGNSTPELVVTGFTTVVVIGCCFLYVDVVGLGFLGPPLALAASWIAELPALIALIWAMGAQKEIWGGFTREAFKGWWEFLKLAIPDVFMLAAEWGAFELCSLFAGQGGDIQLGAFSILYQLIWILDVPAWSIGTCATSRVGNSLGANEPARAKAATVASLLIIAVVETVSLTAIFFARFHWAALFTPDHEVQMAVAKGIPIICLMGIVDQIQSVESGILRGCGLQAFGAVCNGIFYWGVGLPLVAVATFVLHYGVNGIFLAMSLAVSLQFITFSLRLGVFTNWTKMAQEVSEREKKQAAEGNQEAPISTNSAPDEKTPLVPSSNL